MDTARIATIDYQRNGIAGEGFHSLQMDAEIEGVSRRFIATVFEGEFSEDADGNEIWGGNGRCGLQEIDENGMLQPTGWRGDRFESALREAIALTDDDRFRIDSDGNIHTDRNVDVRLTCEDGVWAVAGVAA